MVNWRSYYSKILNFKYLSLLIAYKLKLRKDKKTLKLSIHQANERTFK